MAITYSNIQVTKVLTLRGNTIQNNRYTGLPGELTVDTEAKTIRIHDGVTPGGNTVQGGGSASSYANANVKVYLTQFNGNIIPSANVTYTLGNITHQWRDLFVSNNTIYVGGVPLGIDATGNLTVNGNIIPTIGYVNAQVANVVVDLSSYALNANVTAANVGLKGYVDQANSIQSSAISSANIAIKGYIDQQITDLIGGAPSILDTLNEIAASINDDANVYTSLINSIATANTALKGYVDQANTIQSAQLTSANLGIIGYIDQANTIQSAQVGAANLAITAANVGMRGYVDSQSFYSNVKVETYLQSGNIANVSVAGNVTATYFVGNGALLTGIAASSNYSNVQVASYLATATINTTGNITAGNLFTSGALYVANITTTGASGNISGANYITANYFVGNGALLTGLSSSYSNVQVATYLPTYDGVVTAGNVAVNGNVTAQYFLGNGALLTGIVAGAGNYSNVDVKAFLETDAGPGDGFQRVIEGYYSNIILGDSTKLFSFGNSSKSYFGHDGFANININYVRADNSDVRIATNNAAYTWVFNNGGNLTFPGNLVIAGNTNVFGTNGALIQPADDLPLIALSSGANGAVSSIWVEDVANIGTSNIASVYANPTVGSKIVRIAVGQNGGAYGPNLWDFGNTGTTRFPNSTILAPAGQNITMQSDQYAQLMWENANLTVAPDTSVASNFYVAQNSATLDIVYRDGSSNQQQKSWLWTLDGNLKLPSGGYILNSDDSIYGGGDYSNVQVAAYLNTQGYNLYSNVNVAAYLSTATITTTGNITAQNLIGNISITGNVTGTSANVTLQAGAYTSVFDNQGNVRLPTAYVSGNVTANYFVGNGALLTGIVAGSNYSNVQVATYLAGTITTGNINVGNTGSALSQVTIYGKSSATLGMYNSGADVGAQIYLGDFNFNSGTKWNSAPGIGATYDSSYAGGAYGLGLYTYDGADNSRTLRVTIKAGSSAPYGGEVLIFSNSLSTSTTSGALQVYGGVGVGGNLNVGGNVTATNFVGSGSLLSGVATKTTGSWTVTTGTNTYSIQLAENGTYQLWVIGNIPNGIISYNATATITNSNVPVVGAQYAWVYNGGGTPIDFTSIPNQFVGTGNTIVRSSVAPSATTNRFDFGINNTSGGNVTVSYGYVKIS